MFRVGLNPYGLTYTLGLQGAGTPRANPRPIGLDGFIDVVREAGVRSIELDWRWLTPMSAGRAGAPSRQGGRPDPDLQLLAGAATRRDAGARHPLRDRARRADPPPAPDAGRRGRASRMGPAMEGHGCTRPRDAEAGSAPRGRRGAGPGDREPSGFRQRGAGGDRRRGRRARGHRPGHRESVRGGRGSGRVRAARRPPHPARAPQGLHRAVHRTRAIGWCAARLATGACRSGPSRRSSRTHSPSLTASLEPGALEVRHIRLFTPEWWIGYPPRAASELGDRAWAACATISSTPAPTTERPGSAERPGRR